MAKSNKPLEPLSEKQREIMEIVWEHGEVSAIEVRDELSTRRKVARNTVRTTMERLEDKGWLTHRVIGRTYFYSAVVPRDVNVGKGIVEFIDNICGGKPESMMTALLEYRGLTADEVQRIEAMLANVKKSAGSKKQ